MITAQADARRLAVLQRVTAALMSADTVEEVSAIILDELFRAKRLVAGAVAVVDEDADWLRLAASRGISAEAVARTARMPLTSRSWPVVVAARTGKPEFLSSRAEVVAAYPTLHASSESLTQSIAVLPLEAELGPVGALAISFAEPTSFGQDLREFLLTLARTCARAIERALLVESERVARVRAARLQRITEDLAGAETQESVARQAVRLLAELLEAESVALYLWGAEDGLLARTAAHGSLPDDVPPTLSLTSPAELASVVRAKQARYVDSDADTNGVSCAHLPLLHDGKAIGGVALRFAGPRRFPADARAYYGAIAHQVSLALDRARLREENQRRSRHLAALADASALFAAQTLDVEALAQSVARFASETVGDPCLLSLVAEDGAHVEAVALEGTTAEEEAHFWAIAEQRRLRIGEGFTGASIVSGQPMIVPVVRARDAGASLQPEHLPLLARFDGGGAIAVPLRAHGETLGALTLMRRPGRPPYARDDLSLLVDIGERAALALYTARLYDETQGAVRVRDDFLSIAGHELRTPLTALHLQLQAMVRFPERASSPDAVRESARKMAQQTDRLGRLITELLDVSRIVRGRLTLERSEVDLVEVMRTVLEICEPDLRRADCEVLLGAPASLVGRWDRTRVEQVLQNLLLNACKYGRGRPVTVELREEDGCAVVVVVDQGIGIPPEDQARIFERFERAVPSRHFGGFGLGLWISRQVVEAHGGRISVDSAPGEGATFRVALPCARGQP